MWQQLLGGAKQHRLLVGIGGCALLGNACYYGLHGSVTWYRAFSASCTQEGTQEMLLVNAGTQSLLAEVAEKLQLPAAGEATQRLVAFTCRGHEPLRYGRLGSALGAYLGLPDFLQQPEQQPEQQPQPQRQALYFMDRLLSLSTRRGRQLYEECLVLTDAERRFAIARELAYLHSRHVHSLPAVCSLAAIGCAANVHWLLSDKGELLLRQVTRRYGGKRVLQPLLVAVTVALWAFMSHQWYAAYCKTLDASADARAAAAYPAGAVSFYEKMIKRNMLLHSLLGDDIGGKYFTVQGNEKKNWLLSEPFLPVNQRCSKLRHSQQLQQRQQQQQQQQQQLVPN